MICFIYHVKKIYEISSKNIQRFYKILVIYKFYKKHIEQERKECMLWGTKWQKLPRIYAHYVYASNHSPFGTARGKPFATAVHIPCLCDPRCCRTVRKVLQCRCHHCRVHRCRRHRPPLRAVKSFSDALPWNSWSRANLKITYHKAPSSQYTKLFYKKFPLIWKFFRGCSSQFHRSFLSAGLF